MSSTAPASTCSTSQRVTSKHRIISYGVVFLLDSHVPASFDTQVKITGMATNSCSGLCKNGATCKDKTCECGDGHLGYNCEKEIYAIDSDSFERSKTLAPFEGMFFAENYENGEPDTTILVKAVNRPPVLMLVNESDSRDKEAFFWEKNSVESKTILLKSWSKDAEERNVPFGKKWGFVFVTNLSTGPVDVKVTVARIRSNTFGVITTILMILLSSAIGLLVLFVCITSCLSTEL